MKTIQRFLGIALTMLFMAAFPSTAAAYTSAEKTAMQDKLESSPYTVFFDNSTSSWEDVYCYWWDKNNTSTNNAGTSGFGDAMEALTLADGSTSNIYFYSYTSDLADYGVLFNNGSWNSDSNTDNQTGDLTWAAGTLYNFSGVVTSDISSLTVFDGASYSTNPSAGLYLVGDFFSNSSENTDFKYSLRLTEQSDGSYSIQIPATLTATFSLVKADGNGNDTYYGASSSDYTISASTITAGSSLSDKSIVSDDSQYKWSMTTRTNDRSEDGTYTFSVTLSGGVPSTWTITHTQYVRISYYVHSPAEVDNPVLQACTLDLSSATSFDDRYFGYIYLGAGEHAYFVSNVYASEYTSTTLRSTMTKLYSQGSIRDTYGIFDNDEGECRGTDYDYYGNLFPEYGYGTGYEGFILSEDENIGTTLECKAGSMNNMTNDINGKLEGGTSTSSLPTKMTSVSIIGDAVIDGDEPWSSNNFIPMDYDAANNCYTYTLTTTNDYKTTLQYFRFIANDSWSTSWQEDGTEAAYKARVPYDETGDGHAATEADPNEVSYLSNDGTTHETAGGNDIIFNRPAGVWTIKFYIETTTTINGSTTTTTQTYYYTITGEEAPTYIPVNLTYINGDFICTYSSETASDLQEGIKAYVAYKYSGTASEGSTDGTPEGTLYMRQMDYVPANVGVMLIAHEADVSSYITEDLAEGTTYKFTALLTERSEESATSETDYPSVWTQSYSDAWHNFLRPGRGADYPGNADSDNDDEITERYFALSLYSFTENGKKEEVVTGDDSKDYYGFFRLKPTAYVAVGRAYLYLPEEEEGTGDVTYGTLGYSGQILSDMTYSSIYDDYISGSKGISRMVFDDEEGYDDSTTNGITTIQEAVAKSYDDAYYTLQGIRVTTPNRGIYIHNGKKIVVR